MQSVQKELERVATKVAEARATIATMATMAIAVKGASPNRRTSEPSAHRREPSGWVWILGGASTRYISKFNSVLIGNPDSQRLDSNLAKSVLIAREICPDRVGGIASAVFGLRPNPAPPQSFLPPQPPAASHECRLLLPTARQPPQSEAERAYAMAHARHTQPRHAVASLRQQRET